MLVFSVPPFALAEHRGSVVLRQRFGRNVRN
jgi:hypothetical protein